ncbi:MAG: hypothetical protein P4M09_14400 [Devosia sp.]|nr:hypothetical protein [Devosia sp.]
MVSKSEQAAKAISAGKSSRPIEPRVGIAANLDLAGARGTAVSDD